MANIINGTQSAKKLLSQIQRKVTMLKQQGRHLKMAVVLVGEDLASLSFIRKKEESCKKIGIAFELFKFQADIDTLSLCQKIKIIQEDPRLSALVVKLPLPPKVNTRQVLEMIDPRLDVDCLTSHNLGKLASGIYKILPPTPAAILHLIKEYNINLQRKHIVIVGKGELVGKPLGILLTQDQNTLTICTKFTKNLGNYTRQADVLITAVGKPNLINASMIKDNIIILDAGTSYKGKKLYGDVNYKQVLEKVKMITPVPGGIGPVTVAKLLENILLLANN